MKIAFDENIPPQMVRVFKALGREKRFKIDFVSAIDYTPKVGDPDYVQKSDVPWLTRFAEDDGRVIVSGDVAMLSVPHELEALRRHKFIVFMFEKKWNEWAFHQKTALLLFNWPLVRKKLRTAKPGEFWCIPNHFREDGELRDVTPGARQIQKKPPRIAVKKTLPAPKRPIDDRQGTLELPGGASGKKESES